MEEADSKWNPQKDIKGEAEVLGLPRREELQTSAVYFTIREELLSDKWQREPAYEGSQPDKGWGWARDFVLEIDFLGRIGHSTHI